MLRALLIGAVVVGLATPAAAQSAEGAPRPADQPRPLPDYDGRPDPAPSPERALLWVPRVALAPLHLVFEYLLRRPLAEILGWVERENLHFLLIDLVTWDERNAGLVPTAFYDFGLMPSAGLYFFWNDVGAPGHQLRATVGFGGVDWLQASIWDRVLLSSAGRVELTFRASGSRRPDRVYQGLGALTDQGDRARFRRDTVEGAVELAMHPWRRSRLAVTVEVSGNDFADDGYAYRSGDPSLDEAIQTGTFAAPPPGFDGYVAYRQRLVATLDSREEAPAPQHGVRVDVEAEQALDLLRPVERRWIRYGGALAGFVDLGAERVLSLHARAEFVDALGSDPIPFTEQVRLGGDVLRLAGFLSDQLIGESGVVASLRYRYPVWTWLDASLFVSVGNVFDARLADFAFERLRLSGGFGLQSLGDRDHALHVTVALGTAPFERGTGVESVRVLFGGRTPVF